MAPPLPVPSASTAQDEPTYLESCIRHRHSIRFYKPEPVPTSLLYPCLQLAQLAPSNSNIQNWRITLASGARRERIVGLLSAAAERAGPNIPALPEEFRHFRSEFGHLLYGEQGYHIGREEKAAHRAATMRNYRFFDAPTVAVITMPATLAASAVDAMAVGMFVQTFMLALTERGLGSCLMVSVTGYPELLREGFGLSDDQSILCGMAIGWPEQHNAVNDLVVPREDLDHCVTFLED